jgi:DNA invertase Pin-like site-specific DNA recombinase
MSSFRVGYSRVSTADQNLDRQTATFDSLQLDYIHQDKVSGATPFAERPAGRRLLKDAEAGNLSEIHFTEVSRVGRDVVDITVTLHRFAELGIQVIVHKEGIRLLNDDLKTLNPTAQIILSVMSALSMIERQHILERQREGIAVAKAKGKYIGRRTGTKESPKAFLGKPKNRRILELLEEGLPMAYIAKIVECSHVTVAKVRTVAVEEGKLAA